MERAGDTRHNFPENYKQKYSPLKWTHRHSEGARLTLTARGDDVKSEKRRGEAARATRGVRIIYS